MACATFIHFITTIHLIHSIAAHWFAFPFAFLLIHWFITSGRNLWTYWTESRGISKVQAGQNPTSSSHSAPIS